MSEQQILSEIKDLKAMLAIPVGRWLNMKDACKHARCGKQKLIEMYYEGKIKAMQHPDKLSGQWLFDRESIDAYYESLCDTGNINKKAATILKAYRK